MPNSHQHFFVVGDTFAGTASKISGLLDETEALEKVLTSGRLENDVYFHPQQGVDLHSIDAAVRDYNADTGENQGKFHLVSGKRGPRATRRYAHKNRAENIVICAPRRLSNTLFEMDLCFSAQNEFFLDHMTGMHIQGMVLIEAARQAFLAVTEAYYLKGDERDYYFVIKSMDTQFQNFVFPFDAVLRYEVTRASQKDNRHGFDADISIIQSGNVCTTIKVAFTAFEAKSISDRELVIAQDCVNALMTSYQGAVQPISASEPQSEAAPAPVVA